MIALAAVDLLGVFIEPAVICLLAALALSYGLRRALDRLGINHLVWHRALFDFSVLVAITALLVLSLRPIGS